MLTMMQKMEEGKNNKQLGNNENLGAVRKKKNMKPVKEIVVMQR